MSRSDHRADVTSPGPLDGPAGGVELPELTVTLDTVHLFMFSAVTWNRHLIHYDGDQARLEGHDAVVAQRSLLGNYFARQVTDWLGGDGRLTGLTWKVVRGSVPGDVLTCRGVISSRDGAGRADDDRAGATEVTIEQQLTNQDGVTVAAATATAVVGGDGGTA